MEQRFCILFHICNLHLHLIDIRVLKLGIDRLEHMQNIQFFFIIKNEVEFNGQFEVGSKAFL